MANCTKVIKLAMRKLQLIASGENPSAQEGVDYLELLTDLYWSWIETGVFGELTNVIATADYEAKENERIRADGFTITYPLTIVDTDTGESRVPRDLAIVVVVTAGSDPVRKLYDANRGEWVALQALTANGEAPLSSRGLDGLASCLALQFAAENGSTVDATVALSARSFKGRLANQASTQRATVPVEYF